MPLGTWIVEKTNATGGGGLGGAVHDGHTWGLVGDVTALTTLPSLFVPLLGAQPGTLVGIRTKIGSGTSVGVQVKRNGSNVGSVITVTTTPATTTLGPVTLANNDEIWLVLSAPVSTPSNFSATLILEGPAGAGGGGGDGGYQLEDLI